MWQTSGAIFLMGSFLLININDTEQCYLIIFLLLDIFGFMIWNTLFTWEKRWSLFVGLTVVCYVALEGSWCCELLTVLPFWIPFRLFYATLSWRYAYKLSSWLAMIVLGITWGGHYSVHAFEKKYLFLKVAAVRYKTFDFYILPPQKDTNYNHVDVLHNTKAAFHEAKDQVPAPSGKSHCPSIIAHTSVTVWCGFNYLVLNLSAELQGHVWCWNSH